MVTTPASEGQLFLCDLGHVDPNAVQERAHKLYQCAKIGCIQHTRQVPKAALSNLVTRSRINTNRLIRAVLLGRPL